MKETEVSTRENIGTQKRAVTKDWLTPMWRILRKEKESVKQEQQKKEPVKVRKKKNFNFDEQLGKKETKPVPKMDGVEVVDYKERSYAVFGNTYDIKD